MSHPPPSQRGEQAAAVAVEEEEDLDAQNARSSVIAVLEGLENAIDPIKAFTRTALVLYGEKYADLVVSLWRAELTRRLGDPQKDALACIYACNDLLQESRKNGDLFIKAFRKIVKAALLETLRKRPELKSRVYRVMQVWNERRVFPKRFMRVLEHDLGFHDLADALSDDEEGEQAAEDRANEEEEENVDTEKKTKKMSKRRRTATNHGEEQNSQRDEDDDEHRDDDEENSDDEDDDDDDDDDPMMQRRVGDGTPVARLTPEEIAEQARAAAKLRLKRFLQQLPLAKLYALHKWTEENVSPVALRQLIEEARGMDVGIKLILENKDVTSAGEVSKIQSRIEKVKRLIQTRSLALEYARDVREVLGSTLDRRVTSAEDALVRTTEEYSQCSVLEGVLEELRSYSERRRSAAATDSSSVSAQQGTPPPPTLEAEYAYVRTIPKRQKQTQIQQEPTIEEIQELRKEKEEIKDGPMIWHKGLGKYVALPKLGEEEVWR